MSLLLIGKIQTLLDRLTSGRATALDAVTETRMARLNDTVTSRAAAATALTNATWTDARAEKIDNLDAVLSTLPGRVKSIQTGYVASGVTGGFAGEDQRYLDVTISAVANTAKCICTFQGAAFEDQYSTVSSTKDYTLATAKLTSTSNLRLGMRDPVVGWYMIGRWTVVEYY